ncbi:MAG TPA: PHB depolymerase family esterase [Polyangiaceae bacterium]
MRAALLLAVALAGCETRSAPPLPVAPSPTATAAASSLPLSPVRADPVAARPYGLHVPATDGGSVPIPLVVFFHGYGASGAAMVRAIGLEAVADAHGFALAYPDGTVDSRGRRFWNATDACCDFDRTGVDDVGYVRALLDDVGRKVRIDSKRVYVFGHSNGGFFAQRLACDLSQRIAAAVSMAGAAWKDPSRCTPSEPVSVLAIAGDKDPVIRAQGGTVFDLPVPPYPSLRETLAMWLAKDRCTGALSGGGNRVDFDALLPGTETTMEDASGCPTGITVSEWTVAGGSHVPSPSRAGVDAIWAWMAAHPKR